MLAIANQTAGSNELKLLREPLSKQRLKNSKYFFFKKSKYLFSTFFSKFDLKKFHRQRRALQLAYRISYIVYRISYSVQPFGRLYDKIYM